MTLDWTPLAWATVTIGVYFAARLLYRRLPRWWTAPMLVTLGICITLALVTGTRYAEYLRGTGWLMMLLGPAMVAFAVPLYEQRAAIRRHWPVLAVGVSVGSVVALLSAWALSRLLGLPQELELSVLPRSISTPFAMEMSGLIGGIPELTATCVMVTGILGATLGELLIGWLPLRTAFARGALFGMGAHAVGMATARELGVEEGTVAGLVMIIAGVVNVGAAALYMSLAAG